VPRRYGEEVSPFGSPRRPWPAWHAAATGERDGQLIYSAIAIETGLALRLMFHQPLRQTEGLHRAIAKVLEIDIAIPDHTTLSRRCSGLRSCQSGSSALNHYV
jgi:Transposase DDE domain